MINLKKLTNSIRIFKSGKVMEHSYELTARCTL